MITKQRGAQTMEIYTIQCIQGLLLLSNFFASDNFEAFHLQDMCPKTRV